VHRQEMLQLAVDSLRSGKTRLILTALGMVIGTASVILVVTIGLTGKEFILAEIQKIGTNEIVLEYGGSGSNDSGANQRGLLTPADEKAVVTQLPDVKYSSPVLQLHDRVSLGDGSTKETTVLGVSPQYIFVRNLLIQRGRFFDEIDDSQRAKCAVVTETFARKRFGNAEAAIGQQIFIRSLPFTIIGVFKQSVNDFGQSEIAVETILVPYSVARYYTGTEEVHMIYFSMTSMAGVPRAAEQIRAIVSARHNPSAIYVTQDLGDVLHMAATIANIITAVLILVSAVTLIVGGVGIMNIMLANVRARINEIGIRKALGATYGEIRFQFLSEAVIISLTGGVAGCAVGLLLPVAVRLITGYNFPINLWSVAIALAAAMLVGITFGTVPAMRAAQLHPVDSLRFE
jgi:putative ABC transport system permease protein